jgi:hypothetical protein
LSILLEDVSAASWLPHFIQSDLGGARLSGFVRAIAAARSLCLEAAYVAVEQLRADAWRANFLKNATQNMVIPERQSIGVGRACYSAALTQTIKPILITEAATLLFASTGSRSKIISQM